MYVILGSVKLEKKMRLCKFFTKKQWYINFYTKIMPNVLFLTIKNVGIKKIDCLPTTNLN